jgi:DNA-binding CsgD family transcriptional regulator
VHKHVEHIYRKLDVHDRHEAVERALALGVSAVG